MSCLYEKYGREDLYLEEKIDELKQKLADSDYKTIKHMEGYYTDAEWDEIKSEREAIREQIRELENELS